MVQIARLLNVQLVSGENGSSWALAISVKARKTIVGERMTIKSILIHIESEELARSISLILDHLDKSSCFLRIGGCEVH